MILTCPECTTRYDIDGAKFPAAGRKVRCKKCGHVWFQAGEKSEPDDDIFLPIEPAAPAVSEPVDEPPQPEAEPEPAPVWRAPPAVAPAPEKPTAAKAPVPKRKNISANVAVVAGWIALIGAILLIGWSATSYRQQVASAWPQSASLFARMGMAVNTRGLDFADVRHINQSEDGQPVLVITGKLVNIGAQRIKVPPLRVTLSDEARHAIYGWSFAPATHLLAPGQSVAFRTRLSNPPAAARHVDIRFADGAE